MRLKLHQFDLPLRHTFTIARGSTRVQPTLIIELEQDGQSGYGEATTSDYYGATQQLLQAAAGPLAALCSATTLGDPAAFWEDCRPLLEQVPFLQCAVDQAAHDLWGKLAGVPVHTLWGLSPANAPRSSFTIGIDAVALMREKLKEEPGWPAYKVKAGATFELATIRQLRQLTTVPFRIDANGSWNSHQARELGPALAELGVEMIEQPLPPTDRAGSQVLYRDSPIPVFADESCVAETDVDQCAEFFHGVNIKLVKCGGLIPARRMIERARALGLQVMLGCMTESTVGISAIAQLLPLVDFADVDGAVLLARDIARGVRVVRGQCYFPPTPGTGVTLTAS